MYRPASFKRILHDRLHTKFMHRKAKGRQRQWIMPVCSNQFMYCSVPTSPILVVLRCRLTQSWWPLVSVQNPYCVASAPLGANFLPLLLTGISYASCRIGSSETVEPFSFPPRPQYKGSTVRGMHSKGAHCQGLKHIRIKPNHQHSVLTRCSVWIH